MIIRTVPLFLKYHNVSAKHFTMRVKMSLLCSWIHFRDHALSRRMFRMMCFYLFTITFRKKKKRKSCERQRKQKKSVFWKARQGANHTDHLSTKQRWHICRNCWGRFQLWQPFPIFPFKSLQMTLYTFSTHTVIAIYNQVRATSFQWQLKLIQVTEVW